MNEEGGEWRYGGKHQTEEEKAEETQPEEIAWTKLFCEWLIEGEESSVGGLGIGIGTQSLQNSEKA